MGKDSIMYPAFLVFRSQRPYSHSPYGLMASAEL